MTTQDEATRRCEIVGEMALEEFAARALRAAET